VSTRRHLIVPGLVWAVLSIAADLTLTHLNLPPGYATTTAAGQSVTGQVFSMISATVGIAVVVFAVYFLVVFRGRPGDAGDGPPVRGDVRLQSGWLVLSTVIVLFAAAYGSIELEGQVTPQLVVPASQYHSAATRHPLIVQVIGQQWQWTYRYPQYGGFESPVIRIPANRLVQFDVTSLDVIHGWWAYTLGIKVNAEPGVNNVGYVYALKPSRFIVECSSLCGLWHGYMRNTGAQDGEVLSQSAFASWVKGAQRYYGPEDKYLPKFALVYYPSPTTY